MNLFNKKFSELLFQINNPGVVRQNTQVQQVEQRDVEQLEEDVHKNAVKGNRSAGVRVRKSVRKLRVLGAELIKATLASDEAHKSEKAAKAE